jgi:hypothetical protein
MSSHGGTLRRFATKLALLLMFRRAVQWAAVWLFIWGVIILAARISRLVNREALAFGLLGCIPLAAIAAAREWRRREAFSRIRAVYDDLNRCGGVIMAEEIADMSQWQGQLPQPAMPSLRWRGGRAFGLLGMSAVFAAITLLVPDRFAALGAQRPLEVGKLVSELKAEVEALKQEKILDDKKADETQKQLAELEKQSSGLDPNKTWEALDHIKQSDSDLAKQAAEEAENKLNSLSAAETMADAMKSAGDNGMNQDTATRAAEDLAGMLQAAKLEDGLLKGEIPPEMLSKLDGLNKEQLQKLLGAIQFNKGNLGKAITNLANLKMIDAKLLAQCQNAGQCENPNALAEYLSTCTNAGSCNLASLCYGKGGPGGGGGTGPMTWQDKSSEDNLKFKENALPPSPHLADAQFVGVTRSAPELSGAYTSAEHGSLVNAQGSGGSANAQVILPEHRQAVQRFFKRDAQ